MRSATKSALRKWLAAHRPAALRIAACLLASGFFILPARAEFAVCNQTLDVINLAIGQRVGSVDRTQGWWIIGSDQCATPIREELQNRYIYVYATDVFGQPIVDGTVAMCIGSDKFVIDGIDQCWQRGLRQVKFMEVDTKAAARWTLFLSDPTVQ